MSAQAGPFNGTKIKSGEERRFREGAASVGANSIRGGMFMKRLPGGTFLEPRKSRGSVSTSHPFKVRSFGDNGTLKFRVEPGTFNGSYPEIDGTPINEDGAEGDLGSGTQYVYLKVTYSFSTANDYVYAGTVTASEITATSTEQTDPLGPKDGPTADFYILLASFEGGKKNGQPIVSSLTGEICGVSNASAKASLMVLQS